VFLSETEESSKTKEKAGKYLVNKQYREGGNHEVGGTGKIRKEPMGDGVRRGRARENPENGSIMRTI